MTVLFADVIGSTGLGERLDPERLRVILGDYFDAIAAVVRGWGGTVEKFIGDAVMAAFGVPQVREDDARRALSAALEILTRLQDLNETFRARHGVELEVRVGVNSGEVIAPVGDYVEELIVAGDAVNTAARLQARADPGTVLVGHRTWAAARDWFEFSEPRSLELKGKADPVVAHRLLGVRHGPTGVSAGIRAPLVGRDHELGILTHLFHEASARGAPRCIVVHGAAGIGKSRLVAELVGGSPAVRVLRGRCLPAGEGVTYWALSEILREACGAGLGESAGAAARSLVERIGRVLAPLALPDADVTETIAALAATAGIEVGDETIAGLEPKGVAEAMARGWPRFLSALAASGPMIVVVEDLHWAGDQLVELLERIIVRTAGPVLFIATARPEAGGRRLALGAGGVEITSLALSPLDDRQSAALVDGLLGAGDVAPDLRAEIVERADGNAFFLEEIVRRLIDEGSLVFEAGRWRSTGGVGVSIPDTVHGLLSARIDALPPAEKLSLREASVIGRTFWAAPLRSRLPEVDVDASLLALERRGLIMAHPGTTIAGEAEYGFRHALVRDVAYGGLPRARRAVAHAALGRWLEGLAADRFDEVAELIAHHLHMAVAGEEADLAWVGRPGEHEELRSHAYTALMEAGRVARRRYALTRAIELHTQASALAPELSGRLAAVEAEGDDHSAAFHGDEAVEAYLRAQSLVEEGAGSPDDAARLVMKAAREAVMKSGTFVRHPGPQAVDSWVGRGLSLAGDDSLRAWLLALHADLGQLWIRVAGELPGSLEDRLDAGEKAVALAREGGWTGIEVYASEALVYLLSAGGRHQEALRLARARLALEAQSTSPTSTAGLLFESATAIGLVGGDWATADALAMRSREIARRLSPHELMHATGTAMAARYHLGRWDEALTLLPEHLEAYAGEANVSCANVRLGPVIGALVHAHRGDLASAERLLDLVPPLQRTNGVAEGFRGLALVAVGRAGDCLAEVEPLLDRPRLVIPGPCHRARLEALAATGRWGEIPGALAAAGAAVSGDPALGAVAARIEGARLAALGRGEGSAAEFRRGAGEARRLGLPFEEARAWEAVATGGLDGSVNARDRATALNRVLGRPAS